MGGCNDVVYRSVVLMVAVGNNSWERMFVLAMMAVMRAGLFHCRRGSAIKIMQILTLRRYS